MHSRCSLPKGSHLLWPPVLELAAVPDVSSSSHLEGFSTLTRLDVRTSHEIGLKQGESVQPLITQRQINLEGLKYTNHSLSDNKVHGANMGLTWVLLAPDGPHVGPMNLAIRDVSLLVKSVIHALSLTMLNEMKQLGIPGQHIKRFNYISDAYI